MQRRQKLLIPVHQPPTQQGRSRQLNTETRANSFVMSALHSDARPIRANLSVEKPPCRDFFLCLSFDREERIDQELKRLKAVQEVAQYRAEAQASRRLLEHQKSVARVCFGPELPPPQTLNTL